MAGYSGAPLVRKLGLKPAMTAVFVGAPDDYEATLGPLPDDLRIKKRLVGLVEFAQVFCPNQRVMRQRVPTAVRALARDGMLWVCWPKKSSGVATDLGEADVRRYGLDQGLVDVKICAVDETWSGLKFVYRLRDRK